MVILGPFIVSLQRSTIRCVDDFVYTGKSIQVAIDGNSSELPIYIDSGRCFKERKELHDFFVSEEDLNWNFKCSNYEVRISSDGSAFIRLQPVLVTLMLQCEQTTALFFDWLREVASSLAVDFGSLKFPAKETGLLHRKAEKFGVVIEEPISHGRLMSFDLGIDLKLSKHPEIVVEHCCCLSVRPLPNRTLGEPNTWRD